MVWDAFDYQWNEAYDRALRYYNEYENLLVPQDYVTKDNFKLGQWISIQRGAYKTGKLTTEQIEKLESIGMVWDVFGIQWTEAYNKALEYYYEHKNLLVPIYYITKDNFKLGSWIRNQRTAYKSRKLTTEQIEKLESIGMVWEAFEDQWNEGYSKAFEYYYEHKNLRVLSNYVTKDNFKLGQWLGTQRRTYKKGTLPTEQIKKLESIGMVWDVKANKEDIANYLDNECPVKIDKKINKDVLDRVSLIELKSKINFLLDRGEDIVDSKGKLLNIFKMSSVDILNKYGVSLENIIKTYGRNEARK